MSTRELLTDDEMGMLLDRVSEGDLPPPSGAFEPDGEVIPFDFGAQERLARNRFPQLDVIGQRFVRAFSTSLYWMLKRTVEVEAEAVELIKYGEYVDSVEVPSAINLIRMHQLNGMGLLVFDPLLVFLAVDNYFGGGGRIRQEPDKSAFSPTERRIVQLMLNLAFDDLRQAWQPVTALDFEQVKTEVNPRFAPIVTPSELVVVMRFAIGLDGGSGKLHLVVPLAMLEPVRERLESGPLDSGLMDDHQWLACLRREILKARVELTSVLVEIPMSLRQVLALQAGDVLPVELGDRVVIRAAGVPVLAGRFGHHNGRNAVELEEPIDQN